jgi:dTDP-4-amino-4,6-dideoxygalactose transaminase
MTARPINPGAETHLGVRHAVPPIGSITLRDYMGTDASVSRAARVSYGREDAGRGADADAKLINYLERHGHTSPLGAFGDGGLVVTNSDETAAKIKQLRNHGSDVRYYHDVIGYNSRLDEMQAVILRAKLKRIDQYNQARRHVAHLYSELMVDLPIVTPYEDGLGEHVYHQYTLLSDRRDDILKALQDNQIGCAVYYPVPLHQQNVFKEECEGLSLPVTESVSLTCFSLPICPFLEDATIKEIVGIIRGVLTA